MAVTTVVGSACDFKIASTSYAAQVTSGTVTTSPNIARTKTLTDTAYPKVDLVHEADLEFMYDEETGLAGALDVAAIAGTGLALTVKIGDSQFTGTMYVTSLAHTYSGDGVATTSASFIGTLVQADSA
jgi:hypothetical protein